MEKKNVTITDRCKSLVQLLGANTIFSLMVLFFLLTAGIINSCKKEKVSQFTPGISQSFTEEFIDVNTLTKPDGWTVINRSSPSSGVDWKQGVTLFFDKVGGYSGFNAYSYTTSPTEFIYVASFNSSAGVNISSWLITPVLYVKNGDKISFYTRADSCNNCKEQMQVLINKSESTETGNSFNSTGSFTNSVLEINPSRTVNGYPANWNYYEYTFSGITGQQNTRVAFRYFVPVSDVSKGIGIDQFRFIVN
jgi:hypothetical protein